MELMTFGQSWYLVKNNERLFRYDFLAADEHQILQNTAGILGGFKELFVFLMLVKIEVGNIFIVTSAELFEHPCFAHLPHTFENQRFAIRRTLPFQ